jgi:hypothetical protein
LFGNVSINVIYCWIIGLVQSGQEEHTIVPERLRNISELKNETLCTNQSVWASLN